MMAKVRSPNYPNVPLGGALEAIRTAYKSENRNKMSRSVLARHLGYTSLNGRALGKIGAVRAYGLIDGSGDELRISDDAVTALMAPEGAPERALALTRLAQRPTLFQELRKDFPDTLPSVHNLKFALIKRGFTADAAEKAAKNYLSTMSLVAGVPDSYNPPDEEEEAPEDRPEVPSYVGRTPPPPTQEKAKLMSGERELVTGALSKEAGFRLIVTGAVGEKEIDRLIRKLELEKEILADADVDDPDDVSDLA
jgi:hypothetical protein